MIFALSITGLFRTLLIIVGAFILLRFLGQLLNAKRNMEAERKMAEQDRLFEKEKREKAKKIGKTEVLKSSSPKGNIQDVDFEEVTD